MPARDTSLGKLKSKMSTLHILFLFAKVKCKYFKHMAWLNVTVLSPHGLTAASLPLHV